jgi:murein L,D-transpeptidase YcbB/YkuD
MALAVALLESPKWDAAVLETAVVSGDTIVLDLPITTPVFILYMTTDVGNDGAITYYDDIYHRGKAIVAALDKPKPAS